MKALNILLLFLAISFTAHAQMMPQPYKKKLPNIVQYRVEKVMDSENKLFKKNDALYVSLKDGLRHYRNDRLINTYKIIPDSIKRIQVINCHMPPCPPLKITEPAFYVESLKRYFIFFTNLNGNSYLKATPVGYNVRTNEALKEEDISIWYVLKIINTQIKKTTKHHLKLNTLYNEKEIFYGPHIAFVNRHCAYRTGANHQPEAFGEK